MAKESKKQKPRQQRIPGTENKLQDLHDKALEYVEARDDRMSLLEQEVDLKNELLTLMKKHKLEKYEYEDLRIEVVHEDETIRVKLRKVKEEAAA